MTAIGGDFSPLGQSPRMISVAHIPATAGEVRLVTVTSWDRVGLEPSW